MNRPAPVATRASAMPPVTICVAPPVAPAAPRMSKAWTMPMMVPSRPISGASVTARVEHPHVAVDLRQLPHDRLFDVAVGGLGVLAARGERRGDQRALQRALVVRGDLLELVPVLILDQLQVVLHLQARLQHPVEEPGALDDHRQRDQQQHAHQRQQAAGHDAQVDEFVDHGFRSPGFKSLAATEGTENTEKTGGSTSPECLTGVRNRLEESSPSLASEGRGGGRQTKRSLSHLGGRG